MKKSFILTIIYFILMNNLCFAKTVIVDKYGNGDFITIQDALISSDNLVQTIKVLPGIYEENITISKPISVIGSGPNITYIRAKNQLDAAIKTSGTGPIQIQGLKISGNHGVQIESISTTIKNCVIINCSVAIYTKLYISTWKGIITVMNNTIYHNTNGIYFYIYEGSGTKHILGNIIAFNEVNGIDSNIKNGSINYNNVYGNTYNYNNCQKGSNDISKDPKFMDIDTGNYILLNDSPCINSGILGDYFDPDGTRNDMGAYAGPDSAPFWPYITGGPIVTDILIFPASVPQGEPITVTAKGEIR